LSSCEKQYLVPCTAHSDNFEEKKEEEQAFKLTQLAPGWRGAIVKDNVVTRSKAIV